MNNWYIVVHKETGNHAIVEGWSKDAIYMAYTRKWQKGEEVFKIYGSFMTQKQAQEKMGRTKKRRRESMNWYEIESKCNLREFQERGYRWDYNYSKVQVYNMSNTSETVFICWDVEEDTKLFIEFVNETLEEV